MPWGATVSFLHGMVCISWQQYCIWVHLCLGSCTSRADLMHWTHARALLIWCIECIWNHLFSVFDVCLQKGTAEKRNWRRSRMPCHLYPNATMRLWEFSFNILESMWFDPLSLSFALFLWMYVCCAIVGCVCVCVCVCVCMRVCILVHACKYVWVCTVFK